MYNLFGEKWGKRLGRTIVMLVLAGIATGFIIGLKQAVEAIIEFIANMSKFPLAWGIIVSILSALLAVTLALALAAALGIFLGQIVRIGFASPVHRNIDDTLSNIITLLNQIKISNFSNSQTVDILLANTEAIKAKWNTSRTTKFIKWLMKRDKKTSSNNEKFRKEAE